MAKIDIFPHILPRAYWERLQEVALPRAHMMKRMRNIPVLWDLEPRFAIMDQYPDYQQVLTLAAPPIEEAVDPPLAPELARLANDEMAKLVERYPQRFPGFVASLPMNAPEAIVPEIDRATRELGATGVQIFTNVGGRPLDRPEFRPLFERMAELDLPIWVHPARTAATADYADEPRSRYDLWWAFGWPYETSNFMGRMVFSGVFAQHPNLKIITHHCGAMIPYFEGRIGGGLDQLGKRSDDEEDMAGKARVGERPIDAFRRFYGDTALFGSTAGLICGLAFFGPEHVLFGTDMPFDPEGGLGFVRDTIASIERMQLNQDTLHAIYEGNARRLLRLRSA
jgi:predicted TIM-barrel fold metal-dependent hydrolase